MSKLDYLEGERFRSFVDPFRVKFPDRGQVLVHGNIIGTGASSGSGKSSLLLAIQHALGCCPFDGTDLQSWYDATPFRVDLGLVDGDQTLKIRRQKGLKLWENGTEIKGDAKSKDAKLDEFVGLTKEFRSAMTYRGQRRPGMFLAMENSAKNNFLSKLLNVDSCALEAKKAEVRAKELMQEIAPKLALIESLKAEIAGLQEAAGELPDTEELAHQIAECRAATKALVEGLEQKRRELEKLTDEFQHQADTALSELHGRAVTEAANDTESDEIKALIDKYTASLDAALAADARVLREHDLARLPLEQTAATLPGLEREMGWLGTKDAELKAEGKKLSQSICPTCERDWHTEQCVAQLAQIRVDIETNKQFAVLKADQIEKAKEARLKLTSLKAPKPSPGIETTRANIRSLREQLAEVQKDKKASAERAMRELRQSEQDVRDKIRSHYPKLVELPKIIKNLEANIQSNNEHKYSLELNLNTAKHLAERHKERAATVVRKQEECRTLVEACGETTAQASAELDFAGLVGPAGFLGAYFSEALDEISDRTNEILSCVANTRAVSVLFKSENETASGKIQKIIKPEITINGHRADIEAGPSGGMFTSVELAVDLAVGETIGRRRGGTKSMPGWLILDEVFNGLGNIEKESALEVLARGASDKLIIIIDHSSECISSFDKVIRIKNENDRSFII